MTLVEFLTARLDEDEAVARAAMSPAGVLAEYVEQHVDVPVYLGQIGAERINDRVLREVEAKRAILELHRDGSGGLYGDHQFCATCEDTDGLRGVGWPCPTLRHLAAVYADHPDYDEAWLTLGEKARRG